MTLLLALALASLGVLAWLAIVHLAGWWPFVIAAYLYLLLVAAVASIGGINAAMLWLERRRRG